MSVARNIATCFDAFLAVSFLRGTGTAARLQTFPTDKGFGDGTALHSRRPFMTYIARTYCKPTVYFALCFLNSFSLILGASSGPLNRKSVFAHLTEISTQSTFQAYIALFEKI